MIDSLEGLRRTHYCGELRRNDAGKEVILMGWVMRRRDHGGLVFIDLRDREGTIQVVINPEISTEAHQKAQRLRHEYVLGIKGRVALRPEEGVNPNLKTGEIEIFASELKILNESKPLPFTLDDNARVTENLAFKYRYLDLRRPSLQQNIILRHKAAKTVRNFLDSRGFLEIETPFLTKSTPEGARDYLVPSRLNPGQFYALPQSPQLFKQILMIAGYDRYFQIVRCFRDEDLRADRQPEFTQIDIETSFLEKEGLFSIMEEMMKELFRVCKGIEITTPFPRLRYEEAIARYGIDKPDTRYGLELIDITHLAQKGGFKVFQETIRQGGVVKAICAPKCAQFSRKELDDLAEIAKVYAAKGLAWLKVTEEGVQSPLTKYFTPEVMAEIISALGAKAGDLVMVVADLPKITADSLAHLRIFLAEKLALIPKDQYNFLWVVDFPLLEYDENEQRYAAMHHPFTAPLDEDVHFFHSNPAKIRAKAYDMVLNGQEIGGGSTRIHQHEIQQLMFQTLGIGDEEAQKKFGFLLQALQYGTPPHGGIAFGFDRLLMILCGAASIRDVIPFPKTQKASCLMTEAPSEVDEKQLKELGLKLDIFKKL